MSSDSLTQLKNDLRKFAADRDWEQFHSPKNLVMALCGEAGELTEQFQWLTEEQSKAPDPERIRRIADEIADIQIYLTRLADKLDIDIFAECFRKIQDNAQKYPVKKSKGKADKYTEL